MKVEFYRHNINESDIENVVKALNSLILTTGETVARFENSFSQYLGTGHVVGVSSCTAALHLSLLAYGIGPGDEVITTPMSFMATANSILHAGATPVFVDVEEATGNIDAGLIEHAITPRTRAIVPVHLYGQMCNMKEIRRIADKHSLAVIEDAAHAIEAERDGVKVGEMGDTACFSFYATKNITCGEGGAVSTNEKTTADRLRKLSLHGMSAGAVDRYLARFKHYDMESLGWKYNMSNIQAALLLNQLERIEDNWRRREEICRIYEKALAPIPNIRLLKALPMSKHARHLFTILVPAGKRDFILHRIQDKNIGVAVNYRAIHLLSYYRQLFNYRPGMFPIAEQIGDSTITLPLYPKLTDAEVEYVIESVKEILSTSS
jgi:dTDP-4-amino-4,6-dideoxygalactose transaminase